MLTFANMQMLIFCKILTPRLQYVCDFIFRDQLGLEIAFTHNLDSFKASNLPKIYYGNKRIQNGIYIPSVSLLFETGIFTQELKQGNCNNLPTFFHFNKVEGINFDLFAAVFYLLSRYEEYLPHTTDRFERYLPENSILNELNAHHFPLVDHFLLLLKAELKQAYPEIQFKQQNFSVQITFDIDNAYAFRYKGVLRQFFASFGDVFKRDFKNLAKRFKVLIGKETDPFDTYSYLIEMCKSYQLNPIWFVLMGAYGGFDNAHSNQSEGFVVLIQEIADRFLVGIHPSLKSNYSPKFLEREIKQLEEILHRSVKFSRQHYLKLNLPKTYQKLLDLDIHEDFSMGYPNEVGFRAGTAYPFFFYDLDREQQTNLKIHPVNLMEQTLFGYKNLDLEAAKKLSLEIINQVKAVNGQLVLLWHNSNLTTLPKDADKRALFEYQLKIMATC